MRRLVLGIAVAVTSLMPTMGMADDQQIADYIKSRLQNEQQQGNLRGFNVDMKVDSGTVWFKGHVSNAAQEMTILKAAQAAGHLGVIQVVDDIEVQSPIRSVVDGQAAPAQIRQPEAQAIASQQPAEVPQATDQQLSEVPQATDQQLSEVPQATDQQLSEVAQATDQQLSEVLQATNPQQPEFQNAAYEQPPEVRSQAPSANPYRQTSNNEYVGGAATGIAPEGQPMPFAGNGSSMPMASNFNGGQAAAPMGGQSYSGAAPMPASYRSAGSPSEAPNLPGYAWPGYAAHPNYGAVSYPQQYSPSAWPYIGPFYPYPQVPLGWRKVTLEWDDGWWQLDFHDK